MAFLIPLIFLELCAMGSSFSVSCSSSQVAPAISSSRPAAFPPTEIVMRNHILVKGKLKRNSRERLEENGKAKNTGCLLTGMVEGFFTPFPFNYTAHCCLWLTVAPVAHSHLCLIVCSSPSSPAAHRGHPRLTFACGSSSTTHHHCLRLTISLGSSQSCGITLPSSSVQSQPLHAQH